MNAPRARHALPLPAAGAQNKQKVAPSREHAAPHVCACCSSAPSPALPMVACALRFYAAPCHGAAMIWPCAHRTTCAAVPLPELLKAPRQKRRRAKSSRAKVIGARKVCRARAKARVQKLPRHVRAHQKPHKSSWCTAPKAFPRAQAAAARSGARKSVLPAPSASAKDISMDELILHLYLFRYGRFCSVQFTTSSTPYILLYHNASGRFFCIKHLAHAPAMFLVFIYGYPL